MSTIAVGFDVGGTNVRGVSVRGAGPVGDRSVGDGALGDFVTTSRPPSADGLVAAIVELAHQISADENAAIGAVGVGCAGIVDRTGTVRTSPNIAELVDFPLKARLAQHLDCPIEVDNDATTAAWAEAQLGIARNVDEMVFVALGTGIGTGLVVDGRLHHGAAGFAGESGHMVIAHGGIACVCGRKGCWEQYASGSAYGRHTREAVAAGQAPSVLAHAGGHPAAVRSEHVTDLAQAGNDEALAIVETLGYWTAVGIANLVNVLDPSMIVIGGGVADVGVALRDAVRRQYRKVMVDVDLRDPLAIELSEFGPRAGAIGAALLASSLR